MILVEHGPNGQAALFDGAVRVVVALVAAEVVPALAALDAARAAGFWVAGWMAYEAGYALEPRVAGLMPADRSGPLLAFGVYVKPKDAAGVLARAQAESAVTIAPVVPKVSRADYAAAFGAVKGYIAAGDCYQINLTFPMQSLLVSGSALGLYGALRRRQAVGFGAFVDLGLAGVPDLAMPVLISRSPELFIRTDAAGRIESRPMKGTALRDADPVRDAELAEELRGSEKNRAENLMIVDLLRNDISKIARVGSVKVPSLFGVESYATVHQMVSRVVGEMVEPPSMAGLMPALFPCGSITGAPKIRAMEIIREVEPFARGAYCGAIGWMAPEGDSCFSVAIRTLSLTGDRIVLNVGGGVVQDSTCDGEWEEAHWKARYLTGLLSRV